MERRCHGAGRGEPSGEADLAIRVPAFTRRMGFSGDFRCHPHHPPPPSGRPEVNLPPGAEILPWPARSVGRPRSRAAEAPAPSDRPIQTLAQRQQAEKKRITAHRRMTQAPENQLVAPIRIANRTLEATELRDIDDTNPNRRVPRTVKTFRNVTSIDYLVRSGTITRAHGRAANLFRNQHEKSAALVWGRTTSPRPGSRQAPRLWASVRCSYSRSTASAR